MKAKNLIKMLLVLMVLGCQLVKVTDAFAGSVSAGQIVCNAEESEDPNEPDGDKDDIE